MIKVDKETIEINGNLIEVQADLAVLINTLFKNKFLRKDEIMHVVEIALKPREEIEEDIKTLKAEKAEKAEELYKKIKER